MGAWYEDAWNWVKGAASDVYDTVKKGVDVAKEVAPYVAPLIAALKTGKDGKMKQKEFKDTPANRKKLLAFFNKHHKSKITLAQFNKIIDMKGKHKLSLA